MHCEKASSRGFNCEPPHAARNGTKRANATSLLMSWDRNGVRSAYRRTQQRCCTSNLSGSDGWTDPPQAHRLDSRGRSPRPTMRRAALIAVYAAALAVLTGCGSSSKPSPSASERHYQLQISEIHGPCSSSGSSISCGDHTIFVSKLPKLTRAQAIERADQLAHRVSRVVLRVTCHSMPTGWHCVYVGSRSAGASHRAGSRS